MSQPRIKENSNNINSLNNNSFNTFNNPITLCNVNNFGGADERDKILAWLSPLEPQLRHQDIRDHRVQDVGYWLLRREEYRNWLDGIRGGEPDNSALFCYGDPGVGKTHIR